MGISLTAQPPGAAGGHQERRTERGIERLTRDCLAMSDVEAAARIDREVSAAIAASRWDDAVNWQRVRLRVKRLRARAAR
jgi:hypothetical protein